MSLGTKALSNTRGNRDYFVKMTSGCNSELPRVWELAMKTITGYTSQENFLLEVFFKLRSPDATELTKMYSSPEILGKRCFNGCQTMFTWTIACTPSFHVQARKASSMLAKGSVRNYMKLRWIGHCIILGIWMESKPSSHASRRSDRTPHSFPNICQQRSFTAQAMIQFLSVPNQRQKKPVFNNSEYLSHRIIHPVAVHHALQARRLWVSLMACPWEQKWSKSPFQREAYHRLATILEIYWGFPRYIHRSCTVAIARLQNQNTWVNWLF